MGRRPRRLANSGEARGRPLLGAEVVRETGRGQAELAKRACLELPHTFAGHAHVCADLVKRARSASVQAEAESQDAAETRLECPERLCELLRARLVGGRLERSRGEAVGGPRA